MGNFTPQQLQLMQGLLGQGAQAGGVQQIPFASAIAAQQKQKQDIATGRDGTQQGIDTSNRGAAPVGLGNLSPLGGLLGGASGGMPAGALAAVSPAAALLGGGK